jgi:hypothetical protein
VIRSARFLFPILILAILTVACGESERVRRVTRVEYLPLAKDAPVEVIAYTKSRVYDRIAIVDSPHYVLPDYYPKTRDAIEMARHKAAADQHEKMFEKMREDLREMARKLGGDCVQNVRQKKVRVRGILPDRNAPLPGLKTQGYHDEYFLRGEVIKLSPREATGKAPALASADAETSASVDSVSAPSGKAWKFRLRELSPRGRGSREKTPRPTKPRWTRRRKKSPSPNQSESITPTPKPRRSKTHEQDLPHCRHAGRRHRPRSDR